MFVYRHVSAEWQTSDGLSPEPLDAVIQDYVDEAYVTLQHWPSKSYQVDIYDACLQAHQAEYNWLLPLDVDQFVVVRDPCASSCPQQTCR